MPSPVEKLLEEYREALDTIQIQQGYDVSWSSTMDIYARRFVAWMNGRPDWWKVRTGDRGLY